MRTWKWLPILALGWVVGCGSSTPEVVEDDTAKVKPYFRVRTISAAEGTEPNAAQAALLAAVEKQQKGWQDQLATLTTESKPKEFCKAMKGYCDLLDQIDISAAPSAFRIAWGKYVKAVKAVHASVVPVPDTFEEGDFMTQIEAAFKGNGEKAKGLGGDVVQATRNMSKTDGELYTAAEKCGLAVSK
ncbi:MAG: hypothetical protein ACRC8S_17270 [Fimbriiglobus sp.]